MYDFANSAYATSVMSVIFSVYFSGTVVPPEGAAVFGFRIPGESLWGYLISAVMALVIIGSPALGALADDRGMKRPLLLFWVGVGIAGTFGLAWAIPGRLVYASVVFFLSTLGYEMSLVFYNAFLVDVAESDNAGRVSGLGFAVGYFGGGVCLALNMTMIAWPGAFGLKSGDATLPVRASLMVVSLWWLLFSLPTFLWVRDRRPTEPSKLSVRAIFTGQFRQFRRTWNDLRARPELRRFVFAYFFYNDGIQTVLLMASIFGAQELGMNTTQLALCYLTVQFVAFAGALVLGRAADQWSHRKVVLTTLAVFCAASVWALFMQTGAEFWALGLVMGLVLGGSQAASRSLFAVMIPRAKAGEFFALFSIVGKAGGLMGPLVFGVVSQVFGVRQAVFSLIFFFVSGGTLLLRVSETRGRAEALAA